ncbi:MAG: 4-(cytidine 5'-diphospho)-2-C-methyl-D-erythritol kinase [Planctomycetota bacterium]
MRCVEKAYAKVNLFLEVCGKRPDGFHEIDTVMHEVDLYDLVTVEALDSQADFEFVCDDPNLPCGEDNLAIIALRTLERRLGRPLPCRIELKKSIPSGGGMGGGSSDAAAVLRGLNRSFDLGLAPSFLEETAAEFGSDTAFFIRGGTAWARGRGEILEALPALHWHFALLFPGFAVPTAAVFRSLRLAGSKKGSYPLRDWIKRKGPADEFAGLLFNRLETPARDQFEALDRYLELENQFGLRLSGSGSTLFSPARTLETALRQAAQFESDTGCSALAVSSALRTVAPDVRGGLA